MRCRLSIVCAFLSLALAAAAQDSVSKTQRLTIGGYGEAVYKYNFFSDNVFRYSNAAQYKDVPGHGSVDLPHAVLFMNYDFGKGWTFCTEIEFEHGGVEAATELEAEETGEYEKEIERGGEVALEQFWLQKSFGRGFNVRMGHIVVPVGATNNAHLPTEFFGVFRPEGENTILPCTWHETGVSLWGRLGNGRGWRYEVQLVPALNSSLFSVGGWANAASASPYEMRVASRLALAGRIDNYSIGGLRLSVSGYIGNTFNNDIVSYPFSTRYADLKGLLMIGSFDFKYEHGAFLARGYADYGHLNDAAKISAFNAILSNSSEAPYPHTLVGEAACAFGLEAGVNLLRASSGGNLDGKRLVPFVRYDYYDSYTPPEGMADYEWTERQCLAIGLNYRPISPIVIKAEAGLRMLKEKYNNEPWVAVGITWAGMFNNR